MIKIKSLTVKNFMSVGNQTQAVDFNKAKLTLVLGENLDQGGDDSGSRNGTGKTTIINALSYALYGEALTNIRRDNLINKTNGKGMITTVEFEIEGKEYRISLSEVKQMYAVPERIVIDLFIPHTDANGEPAHVIMNEVRPKGDVVLTKVMVTKSKLSSLGGLRKVFYNMAKSI